MLKGKMHGKGIYKYNNGLVYEGNYSNGKRVKGGKIFSILDKNNEI